MAVEMLRDLDEDVVEYEPNYDERKMIPVGLAGALPEHARQRRLGQSRSEWPRNIQPHTRRVIDARSR